MMPWSSLEDRLGGDAINGNTAGVQEMLLIKLWNVRRESYSVKNITSTVLNMLRVPSTCWNLDRVFYVVKYMQFSAWYLIDCGCDWFCQLTILTFS